MLPETSIDGCGVKDITRVAVELQDQDAEALRSCASRKIGRSVETGPTRGS